LLALFRAVPHKGTMKLHLSRVAYGCATLAELELRISARAAQSGADVPLGLTTRYQPKRWPETIGGSLYWIIAHQIVARSPLVGYAEAGDWGDGKQRTDILIAPQIILVRPQAKRAHQGWRYLESKDAPADLSVSCDTQSMPTELVQALSNLGLV
jgi:hypothetical protein